MAVSSLTYLAVGLLQVAGVLGYSSNWQPSVSIWDSLIITIFLIIISIILIAFKDQSITHLNRIKSLIKKLKRNNILLKDEIIKKTTDLIRNKFELSKSQTILSSAYDKLSESEKDRFIQMNKLAHISLSVNTTIHDIRNPLMFIMNEIVHSEIEHKNQIKKAINEIINQVNSVGEIISPRSKSKNFSVKSALKFSTSILASRLKKIAFINENLLDEEVPIFGDESKFKQIVINLLDNALDEVNKKNFPKITLRVEKVQCNLLISVIDNGNGVDNKFLNKLYKPFFTSKEHGNGLGLHISQRYAKECFDGDIIYNRSKRNTTFTFTLPVAKVQ